jgi:hypothetical protein
MGTCVLARTSNCYSTGVLLCAIGEFKVGVLRLPEVLQLAETAHESYAAAQYDLTIKIRDISGISIFIYSFIPIVPPEFPG